MNNRFNIPTESNHSGNLPIEIELRDWCQKMQLNSTTKKSFKELQNEKNARSVPPVRGALNSVDSSSHSSEKLLSELLAIISFHDKHSLPNDATLSQFDVRFIEEIKNARGIIGYDSLTSDFSQHVSSKCQTQKLLYLMVIVLIVTFHLKIWRK